MKERLEESYDVVVVGAGHAGCEAALASARLGLSTILFTVSMDSVAMMPCNPSIGGSSKGHLVREVDALGGEMGRVIDRTFLQSKMLNRSKGPAVHSLRAQADKLMYSVEMRRVLQSTDNLTLRQAEVAEIITTEICENGTDPIDSGGYEVLKPDSSAEQNNINVDLINDEQRLSSLSDKKTRVTGVRTVSGATYHAGAVVLCTGTYLNARCLFGDVIEHTGPNGLKAATHLSDSLVRSGLRIQRFKTGTPARVDRRSLDFSKMVEQKGDDWIVPFSFQTDPDSIQKPQVSCYLTYTNDKTHEIIRAHLDESPMYGGVIEGTGPRYCPSIEDKVVKFTDKDRHQLFIEPEGAYTNEMYIAGMSSSMPEFVQHAMIHTVPGMEHARIVRNAYAIEYDCIEPDQLLPSLECKTIRGLFCGGQLNGSSGYEEAAAQGIVAGINAARFVKGEEAIVIDRSEGYIGVLIDDLVTKENHEPYRMMTSRAEYRLLLRQDNADLRLTPIGYRAGLIGEERYRALCVKQAMIDREVDRIKGVRLGASRETNQILEELGSAPLDTGMTLSDLIKRPELNYDLLKVLDSDREGLPTDVKEQVNIQVKYEGYIDRQKKQVERFRKLEAKKLPRDIDYNEVPSLRLEARQKLSALRPQNIGQASRISGVSPADISVLLVYLEMAKEL